MTEETKTIIPHKCKYCGGELWFTKTNKNYVYRANKKGYWYECNNCIGAKTR